MFSIREWHNRFQQQAAWTSGLRRHVFEKCAAASAGRILEAGSGTGAITADLHSLTQAKIFGVDIDPRRTQYAQQTDGFSLFACADGLHLPFSSAGFDISLCHFYLLWVADPLGALLELKRVTRSGGWVLVLAEPDYGGRVEYPTEMAELGELQTLALQAQGADPAIGRRLPALMLQAGLMDVQSGVLGGEWQHPDPQDTGLEWAVLQHDLGGVLPAQDMVRYQAIEQASRMNGQRLQYIPTFYAMGRKAE